MINWHVTNYFLVSLLLILGSCVKQSKDPLQPFEFKKVYLIKDDSGYTLIRKGKRFFVKGAVGTGRLDYLKECGGNTINLYHYTVSKELLDSADLLDISVAVTIDLGKPRHGANYNHKKFVEDQRRLVDSVVLSIKDHPAVLFWILGNELHLNTDWEPAMWKEVNHLSKRIHSLDANHLVTANIAAFDRKHILQVKYFCEDLDFLSLNAHHKNYVLQRELQNLIWGWEGAYLITEWTGPVYWHNMNSTQWGAIIEPNSTEKTNVFAHSYYVAISRIKRKCLGGFVYYWGEKQEKTHTMFSLILEGKYRTPAIEVLKYYWTGEQIENRAPVIHSFHIENVSDQYNANLRKSKQYPILLNVTDADSDSLRVKIELYEEGLNQNIIGGDNEERPKLIYSEWYQRNEEIRLHTPASSGGFRLFVYVYDEHRNVATSNIPFYVLPLL